MFDLLLFTICNFICIFLNLHFSKTNMYEIKPSILPSQKVVGIEKDENIEDLLREEADECSSLKNEGILK